MTIYSCLCSKPVKRAFRGLRNQLPVQDYWRKILNEIITIKQVGF
jgi:hypothetical protein